MTTQRRNLRTGRPPWRTAGGVLRVPHEALKRDLNTEILIVGAGISGAFMAEALSERHRVTVIDRRGVAKGSTAASTALIAAEIDVPLTMLGRKIGHAKAVRAWQRAALAVRAIETQTAFLGFADEARLARRNSLYLAGDLLDPHGLEAEGEARRAAGLPAVQLSRSALRDRFGVRGAAGLLSFGDLIADPVRLAAGHLRTAVERGATVLAPVEAAGMEAGQNGIAVRTGEGPTISAEQVVFCTGYEMPRFLGTARPQIVSTFAIATRRRSRRLGPMPCLIWEAARPYLYVRDTLDGRVLCGGEDEDIADAGARDALLPAKIRALQRKLGRLMPGLDARADFAWAGTFGETRTGLPIIGEIPGRRGCWAVLNFGGNGTIYSRIAADIVRAALAGGRDADAELFAFGT